MLKLAVLFHRMKRTKEHLLGRYATLRLEFEMFKLILRDFEAVFGFDLHFVHSGVLF